MVWGKGWNTCSPGNPGNRSRWDTGLPLHLPKETASFLRDRRGGKEWGNSCLGFHSQLVFICWLAHRRLQLGFEHVDSWLDGWSFAVDGRSWKCVEIQNYLSVEHSLAFWHQNPQELPQFGPWRIEGEKGVQCPNGTPIAFLDRRPWWGLGSAFGSQRVE